MPTRFSPKVCLIWFFTSSSATVFVAPHRFSSFVFKDFRIFFNHRLYKNTIIAPPIPPQTIIAKLINHKLGLLTGGPEINIKTKNVKNIDRKPTIAAVLSEISKVISSYPLSARLEACFLIICPSLSIFCVEIQL